MKNRSFAFHIGFGFSLLLGIFLLLGGLHFWGLRGLIDQARIYSDQGFSEVQRAATVRDLAQRAVRAAELYEQDRTPARESVARESLSRSKAALNDYGMAASQAQQAVTDLEAAFQQTAELVKQRQNSLSAWSLLPGEEGVTEPKKTGEAEALAVQENRRMQLVGKIKSLELWWKIALRNSSPEALEQMQQAGKELEPFAVAPNPVPTDPVVAAAVLNLVKIAAQVIAAQAEVTSAVARGAVLQKQSQQAGEALWQATAELEKIALVHAAGGARSAAGQTERVSWIGLIGIGVVLFSGVVVAMGLARTLAGSFRNFLKKLHTDTHETGREMQTFVDLNATLVEQQRDEILALSHTALSLAEVESMTRRNAEFAQSAKDLAQQAQSTAESGFADMKRMDSSINAIESSAREMGDAIGQISKSSEEIRKIIKTIDEIAFQTNILALNASVEAARAGAAGAGFAVVADEVRNLAQRSARAAHETSDKIASSMQSSKNGVAITSKVLENLREMIGNAQQVDQRLGEIVEKTRSANAVVGEIAASAQEQIAGLSRVSGSIENVSEHTRVNGQTAEQSAQAAQRLAERIAVAGEETQSLAGLLSGTEAVQRDFSVHAARENDAAFVDQWPVASKKALSHPITTRAVPAAIQAKKVADHPRLDGKKKT